MRKFKGKELSRGDITARADEAYKRINYAEYMVDRKKEGKYLLSRLLMILLYIAVAFAIILVCIITSFVWAIAILPIAIWMLKFYTWPYVSQSYFYNIDSSYFTILKVYGSKYENDFVKLKISEADFIAPYKDEYKEKIADVKDAKVYNAVSSFSANDIYFIRYTEDSKPAIVYFEATEQLLNALKYYNSAATVITKTLR